MATRSSPQAAEAAATNLRDDRAERALDGAAMNGYRSCDGTPDCRSFDDMVNDARVDSFPGSVLLLRCSGASHPHSSPTAEDPPCS